jgi:hypothetical protein
MKCKGFLANSFISDLPSLQALLRLFIHSPGDGNLILGTL